MSQLYFLSLFPLMLSCTEGIDTTYPEQSPVTFSIVTDIAPPAGFKRMNVAESSFGNWLRNLSLKKDRKVYLYNGSLKRNQNAQFAVVDMTVGTKDLQQCADAIMRLRAEYFFNRNEIDKIRFRSSGGTILSFADWRKGTRYKLSGNKLIAVRQSVTVPDSRKDLESFLEFVFSYCGTYSLQAELNMVKLKDMQPGDVFVKGGAPGHAMIVMDVAVNNKGEKIFMLAQSYMPAQDIHIVRNPAATELSPWYELSELEAIITPEWDFSADQLRRW